MRGADVNFYKHHLGDYDSATAHLTWDEDMAYSRLMRAYYREEKPIPLDPAMACRLIRAKTRPQRAAVTMVLEEFFFRGDDGWHNKRCDEEIAQAARQAAINRQIAEEREEKRARSVNGSSTNRSTNRSRSLEESVNLARLQTPDSNIQTPLSKGKRGKEGAASPLPTRLPSDFELTEEREEISIAQGVDPELTFEKFTDHFTAAAGAKGLRADWDAAWRIWCRDEAKGNFGSASRSKPNGANGHSDEAAIVWSELIATEGKRRDPRIQAALDAVGGWSAVRLRTEFEEPKLRSAFCEAYRHQSVRKSQTDQMDS